MSPSAWLAAAERLLTDASPGAHLVFRGSAACNEWWQERERLLLELRNKTPTVVDSVTGHE